MDCSFDSVVEFIRSFQGISHSTDICSDTLLENDLGITGDDGVELIELLQERFEVSFLDSDNSLKDAFDLEDDECLFHSEGLSIPFFSKKEKVKELKVGDIYMAIKKCW